MKHLTGTASGGAEASEGDVFAVLAAIQDYARWYPKAVRRIEVLEWDQEGRPATARVKLYVAVGPLRKELEFNASVEVAPGAPIRLARLPFEQADRESFELSWQLEPQPDGATAITLELEAELDVPRFVPTVGAGDAIAASLMRAAVAQIERVRGTGA
jgi:hypothetical protein